MDVPHTPSSNDQAVWVRAATATLRRDVHPQAELTALFWADDNSLIALGLTPEGNSIFAHFQRTAWRDPS